MEERTFTEAQLVSFGNYLLSDERIERISQIHKDEDMVHFLSQVYDGDLDNWLAKQ